VINRKIPWTSQPQYPAPIDWSNPLTQGLVGLFDSVNGIDLVDGGFPSTNSVTRGVISKGRIANFSNSAQIYPHKPRYATTGALTIFTPLVVTSLANYSGILSKSSNYLTFPFELRLGSSPTTSEIDFQRGGGGVAASAFKGSGSLISANPGVVQYLAVRCISGDLNTAPDVFVNKTKTTLARNGYSIITGTAADNGSSLRVGNRFDTTTYLNGGIQYLGLWNRALSDSEILSLSDNPWQIFQAQPRKLWVSAGGGTDTPVNPAVGSIAITGYAPTLGQTANQAIAPNVGNITITGYAPSISQPLAVNPAVGSLAITGYAPTVTQNVDFPVNPGVGTIAITGYAPTVSQTANQSILPAVGNVAITGYSPTVAQSANQAVLPNVGSLAITGYSPIVQQAPASQSLVPAAGTITITGYAPTVDQSSPIRLGGFEYGSKVYIKRGKKIYIFDSVEEADSYIEAESKAEEIVQQSNRTSRLARKRAREKAHKLLSIEPVDTVDIPALKTLVSQLQTDFELPKLIAQQDWQRVVEIYNQAMEMQDEEDLLLIL